VFKKVTANSTLIITLGVFFLATGVNAINPVLHRIIQAFPDVPVSTIRLLATLPNLTGMLVGILVGVTVGKFISFRTVSLIGIGCFLAGGFGPAIFHQNIWVILAFRALFGASIACLGARNSFILSTVKDPVAQARLIGMGQVSGGIGGTLLALSAGFLADIRWTMAFYPYLIAILPLVVVLLMPPEPEQRRGGKSDSGAGDPQTKHEGIRKWAFLYMIIQFLTMLNAYPVMIGMSTLISARHLGDASTTAMILAICQAGSIVSGAIFGFYYRALKRFALPLAIFAQALGVFFILIFKTVPLICVGAIIGGIATILIMLTCTTYAGQSSYKSRIPLVLSLFNVFGQVSSFVSTYYIEFANRLFSRFYTVDVERTYLLGSIVFGVMTLITLIFNVSPRHPAETNAEG
jgi:MFS family permease